MKKHIIITPILLLCLLFSTSCSNFLKIEPNTGWDVDSFYEDIANVEFALATIYSNFASDAYSQLYLKIDAGTDEAFFNRTNTQFDIALNQHTPASDAVKQLWTILYTAINQANQLIIKTSTVDSENPMLPIYIGEAHFLRAYAYFTLCEQFEQVPMPLTYTLSLEANHMPAAKLTELYAQIEQDLKQAAAALPSFDEANFTPGKPDKYAAHGMLARLYLKMAGYPLGLGDTNKEIYKKAMDACDLVMQSAHDLNPSYKNHFVQYQKTSYDTQESLFEISYNYDSSNGLKTSGRMGALNGLLYSPNNSTGTPSGYCFISPSVLLYNSYEENDERRDWNTPYIKRNGNGRVVTQKDKINRQATPGKYRRWDVTDPSVVDDPTSTENNIVILEETPSLSRNFTGVNAPILRYADVLLMYAEAANEYHDGPDAKAIDCLNKVRNRAGLDNIETTKPEVVASRANFFAEIVDERMRELCFECRRKMDLVRWRLFYARLELSTNTMKADPTYANPGDEAYIRPYTNLSNPVDPIGSAYNKFYSLPYPQQEEEANQLLDKKQGW